MSSRLTRDDARALALEILRGKPDPAVRIRLLHDVLRVGRDDERLRAAETLRDDSLHIAQLREEQRADGSWGRLHSRDTSVGQPIPTTEWAVERALALGLDVHHPVVAAASRHLGAILEGKKIPPDPAERNDRWETGLKLFAAATLSRIDPYHASLDATWDLWYEIARRTFAGGAYDSDAEANAHSALTGASVRGTYLTLSNRYTLLLLGGRASRIDAELRRAMVLWIVRKADGVGYYSLPLAAPPDRKLQQAVQASLAYELSFLQRCRAAPSDPLPQPKEPAPKEEPGKKADLIILDLNRPHLHPVYSILSHLVYSATGADVRDVIIDGRLVMENRRLLTLDEEEILERAKEWGGRISAR